MPRETEETDKQGTNKSLSPATPESRGPAKGHTDSPQREVEQTPEEASDTSSEQKTEPLQQRVEDEPSLIEAEIEVVAVTGGNVIVKFGEGDDAKTAQVPLDKFQGDPTPGKRSVKMSNQAYTQMVIDADPSVIEPVTYKFSDSEELAEVAPADDQEAAEQRLAESERRVQDARTEEEEKAQAGIDPEDPPREETVPTNKEQDRTSANKSEPKRL